MTGNSRHGVCRILLRKIPLRRNCGSGFKQNPRISPSHDLCHAGKIILPFPRCARGSGGNCSCPEPHRGNKPSRPPRVWWKMFEKCRNTPLLEAHLKACGASASACTSAIGSMVLGKLPRVNAGSVLSCCASPRPCCEASAAFSKSIFSAAVAFVLRCGDHLSPICLPKTRTLALRARGIARRRSRSSGRALICRDFNSRSVGAPAPKNVSTPNFLRMKSMFVAVRRHARMAEGTGCRRPF